MAQVCFWLSLRCREVISECTVTGNARVCGEINVMLSKTKKGGILFLPCDRGHASVCVCVCVCVDDVVVIDHQIRAAKAAAVVLFTL